MKWRGLQSGTRGESTEPPVATAGAHVLSPARIPRCPRNEPSGQVPGMKRRNSSSVEASGAVEGECANEEKDEERDGQEGSGSPVERELRDARHRCEYDEDGGSGGDEEPVPDSASWRGFTGGLATVHARFDVVGSDAVAAGFALRGFFPPCLLLSGRGRKRNRTDAEHHEE